MWCNNQNQTIHDKSRNEETNIFVVGGGTMRFGQPNWWRRRKLLIHKNFCNASLLPQSILVSRTKKISTTSIYALVQSNSNVNAAINLRFRFQLAHPSLRHRMERRREWTPFPQDSRQISAFCSSSNCADIAEAPPLPPLDLFSQVNLRGLCP